MDTYYGRLEPMTIRPEMNPQNRLLTDLVVHVAIVIQCNNAIGILTPFVQMINNPGELKVIIIKIIRVIFLTLIGNVLTYNAG